MGNRGFLFYFSNINPYNQSYSKYISYYILSTHLFYLLCGIYFSIVEKVIFLLSVYLKIDTILFINKFII